MQEHIQFWYLGINKLHYVDTLPEGAEIGQNSRGEYQVTMPGAREDAEAWIKTFENERYNFHPRIIIVEEEGDEVRIVFPDFRLKCSTRVRAGV